MCVKWRVFYVLLQILARASARTCLFGYTGGDLIGPYSSTTCERFVALTPKPSLASVSTRSNTGVGTMPSYVATGGPNGNGHISFRRASLQYLDGGARTLNIASNGGLTIVAVMRFTGAIGSSESIVRFDDIIFARYWNYDMIRIWIDNNGQNVIELVSGNGILQDLWMTVVFTYRASTNQYVLMHTYFNDSPASISSGTSTAAVTDRTTSTTYVGRHQWLSTFTYSNVDFAGLFFVDEYLNTDATNQIADAMSNGVDLADTTCPAGNACSSCPVGQYKITPGTAACIDCSTGKYSNVVAVTACSDCVAGTYANTLAATTCIACPTGKYSQVPGAVGCTQCKENSFSVLGSNTATACKCNTGYYEDTCSDFPAMDCSEYYANPGWCDTYAFQSCISCCGTCARVGNTCQQESVCVGCSAGKYDNANDAWTCINCPENSNSVGASGAISACKCKAGYTGPDGVACTGCVTGKYKHTTGNASCTSCLANSNSVTASTTCTCNARFSGPNGGICTACVAGKYKGVTGSAVCADCLNGSWAAVGASSCTTCLAGSWAAVGASSCTACLAGSWAAVGVSSCTTCLAGSWAAVGAASCTTCLAGSSAAVGAASCTACLAGSWAAVGAASCTTCLAGSSAAVGAASCRDCLAGSWAAVGAASCTACPVNSGASCRACLASSNCTCNIGFFGPDGGNCISCAPGTYKNATGSDACTSCPAHTTSPNSSSVVTACVCNPGFYGPNGITCTPCHTAMYKSTTGSALCTSCPSNSGASCSACTALGSCTCNIGFSGPDGFVCTSCMAGTYKNTTGSTSCTSCPANANSQMSSSDCTCNIGFYGPNGGACTACMTGTYKDTTGTALCTSCPPNSGASCSACNALRRCTCNMGFYGEDGFECTACGIGKYKSVTGPAVCSSCPVKTTSLISSSSITACVCNTGFYGPNGIACTPCGTGTYKNVTGSALCSSCPPNSGALCSACISSSSCTCNTGFYGRNGDNCTADRTSTIRTETSTPTSTQTHATKTSTPTALAATDSTDSFPVGIVVGVAVAVVVVSAVMTAICCVSAAENTGTTV